MDVKDAKYLLNKQVDWAGWPCILKSLIYWLDEKAKKYRYSAEIETIASRTIYRVALETVNKIEEVTE